jgi:hypothetical protein
MLEYSFATVIPTAVVVMTMAIFLLLAASALRHRFDK